MKADWFALGEFEHHQQLLEAARVLRQELTVPFDAHTPYPVEGLEDALELPVSRVRVAGLIGALMGASGAYFTLWFTNGYNYPIDVGGRPLNSVPAFIPITFEMAVLFSAVAIFLGVFALSGLPRLYHPTFDVDSFQRASIDRFWLSIPAVRRAEAEGFASRLRVLGAREVHVTEARKR